MFVTIVNFVFCFIDLFPFVAYESVGCYKDSKERRAIESVDEIIEGDFVKGQFYADNYKTRKQAVRQCGFIAKLKGYKMFAVQDGGLCLTSATAHQTYNKYGESQDCKSDGKGGPWANQVYRFPEREGKLNHIFLSSCCIV